MKKIISILALFLCFSVSYGQLFVSDGSNFTSDGELVIYTNEDVVNEGTIEFIQQTQASDQPDFVVDGGLDNSASTATLTFTETRLVIGSGGTNSSSTDVYKFQDRDATTQIGDEVKYVLLNKDGGTVDVTAGHLGVSNHFTSTAGTLNADDPTTGVITLLNRSATQVAQVLPSTGGTAFLESERYFTANRAWRFISPSVTTSTSIQANWMEGATDTGTDPVPGFGTHITGDPANGFDENTSGWNSLFTFDNVNQAWEVLPNVNTETLASPTAYRILVRGDRGVDTFIDDTNSPETVLRNRGELNIGDMAALTTLSTTADDFNLIGNPYHSQVDMDAVLADASTTGINPSHYYIWDPNISGNGGYATIDLSAGGTNSNGSDGNKFLQPMQAAFVQTAATGTPSITFKEAHKKTDDADPTATFAMEKYINLKIHPADDYTPHGLALDGIRINFGDNNMNSAEDDYLHPRNIDETLSRLIDADRYSVEYRNNPVEFEVLQLQLNNFRHTDYIFEVDLVNEFNHEIFIKDNYTEEMILVDSDHFTYEFQVDEGISESIDDLRFQIVFGDETFSTDEFDTDAISLYPNPSSGSFKIAGENIMGETQVAVYNQLGQKVYTKNFEANKTLSVTDFKAATGVYYVKVQSNERNYNLKLQIK